MKIQVLACFGVVEIEAAMQGGMKDPFVLDWRVTRARIVAHYPRSVAYIVFKGGRRGDMTNSAMSQRYKRPLKLWFHGFDRELCTALCTVGQT